MGRPDQDVEPGTPLAEFALGLRELKARKQLTYRQLGQLAGYSASSLAAAASGTELPSLEVTLAYVQACGGSRADWRERWERLRYQSTDPHTGVSARPEAISTHAQLVAALRELRDVKGLSYRDLADASPRQLSRSTLSDYFNGRTTPTAETLRALLVACRIPDPEHKPWIMALERARSERSSVRTEGAAAPLRRVPVADCDPVDLGVHRVGPGQELPAYVPRDTVDGELRSALRSARERGGFVLLVGASGSGKTRAAFEAMKAELPDFSAVTSLESVQAGTVLPPRTVVWLDDLEPWFGRGLDLPTVRTMLAGTGPVILLATMWPDQYHRYVFLPEPGSEDTASGQRSVLRLATLVTVPTILSPTEQQLFQKAARHDASLRAAIDAADNRNVIQTLTAGPHLLRSWELAPPHAKAVIDAAVEAARHGTGPLTESALRAAAAARLNIPEWASTAAEDWFETALHYATARIHGDAAPLTSIATVVYGSPELYYQPNDYLVRQLGTASKPPPHTPSLSEPPAADSLLRERWINQLKEDLHADSAAPGTPVAWAALHGWVAIQLPDQQRTRAHLKPAREEHQYVAMLLAHGLPRDRMRALLAMRTQRGTADTNASHADAFLQAALEAHPSTEPTGATLAFTRNEWAVFLLAVLNGEFETPQ